jgi:hypothetical protein
MTKRIRKTALMQLKRIGLRARQFLTRLSVRRAASEMQHIHRLDRIGKIGTVKPTFAPFDKHLVACWGKSLKLKPKVAITVLWLVVASLSVAGCIQTATPTAVEPSLSRWEREMIGQRIWESMSYLKKQRRLYLPDS